jgi:hypothetical protein
MLIDRVASRTTAKQVKPEGPELDQRDDGNGKGHDDEQAAETWDQRASLDSSERFAPL